MGVLQGTFDTLSLTEVLGLLAQSHKTGALWLEAGSVQGRVYLAEGRCCAAESGEANGPVETVPELATRLVDVCFTLARQQGGSFRFAADEVPTWRVDAGVEIDDAVHALDRLLEEWRDIQAVIPSLDCRPRLADELGSDSIIIDQPRWKLLVSLDGRRSVRDVMHETQRSVLEICNALKELVEEGAVQIAEPTPEPVPAAELASAFAYSAPSEPEPVLDETVVAEAAAIAAEYAADAPVFDEDEAADADEREADAVPVEMPDPFAGADEPTSYAETDAEATPEPEPDVEPVPDAYPEPALGTAPLEEGDPRDRGALLRLFSALRDA